MAGFRKHGDIETADMIDEAGFGFVRAGPAEIVSKVERRDKSCHNEGWQAFCCPHPNSPPEGEGAHLEPIHGSLPL